MMKLISTIALAVFVALLAHDVSSNIDRICHWLISRAARLAPTERRGRLEEEWMADIGETSTVTLKLLVTLGFFVAAFNLRLNSESDLVSNWRRPLGRNRVIKRVSDYALTIPLFLVSLPVMLIAALGIKIASRGPVFSIQECRGLGHRTFRMWHLRTMYRDAEDRPKWHLAENPQCQMEREKYMKTERDPRIVPGIGRYLRDTGIDRLPQLWDVLRGEMSLIGPRPFPEHHLEKFTDHSRELRNYIRPGLTGIWQFTDHSDADIKAQEELDMHYIRNWSPWLDLYILARAFIGSIKKW